MKICYLGIYKNPLPRDRVYLRGFKERGIDIVECIDSSRFLIKFWKLFLKHFKIQKDYDFMMVGYLANIMVPFARLITRKKILYNALNPMYEAMVLDRETKNVLKIMYYWLVDFLAFRFADIILVESEEQKRFIVSKFKAPEKKVFKVYTGVLDNVFYPDESIKKVDKFQVVFRGGFLPATGVEVILEAANILKNEEIKFLIMGRGQLENKIKGMIKDYSLNNLELITEFLDTKVLREKILSSHVFLGQFSNYSRLDRTIQNKTFEALAVNMPYLTRDSISNRELLEDRKNCLFVKPNNPQDLVDKILELKNDVTLRENIAKAGYELYKKNLTSLVLSGQILEIIKGEWS
jgi:glycosyltransferase involved in cell wall biosynthesis